MKVNFEKMTQKNTRSGWEKRLRCAVKDAKDTNGLFQLGSHVDFCNDNEGDQYVMTAIRQFFPASLHGGHV